MDISEDQLLEAIRKVLSDAAPEIRVGVGDDAAVVAPGSGEMVLTTDGMVDGTHFVRSLTTARDLGYKAVVVNLSDLAAMGASPRYGLCALTLPDDIDAAWVMELFGGMREGCEEHALWLVGGNLTRGRELSVTVTAIGESAPGRSVLRSGARPGDGIVVTGSLGGAAVGRGLVEAPDHRGLASVEREAVQRFVRPAARVGEAALLARSASAMIDLSDGLAKDLARLCQASGVGARLDLASIPLHPAASTDDALGGGEDYELLATLADPIEAAAEVATTFGTALTSIGEITEGSGLTAITPDGDEPLENAGWDPFA